MVKEIADKLYATMQTSKEKGKQCNGLKVGSKKKRSKHEMDQVREEEFLLKTDKQAYLLEMKRLKDQADRGMQN